VVGRPTFADCWCCLRSDSAPPRQAATKAESVCGSRRTGYSFVNSVNSVVPLRDTPQHSNVHEVWAYVLMMGVAVFMDPVRVGIAAVLMSRRQAIRNFARVLAGRHGCGCRRGHTRAGTFHDVALVAIQNAVASMNEVRSAVGFTGGRLQIAFGLLALVGVAVMAARQRARVGIPVAVGGGDAPGSAPQSAISSFATRLGQRRSGHGGIWRTLAILCCGPRIDSPTLEGTDKRSLPDHGLEVRTWDPVQRFRCVYTDGPDVSSRFRYSATW